MPVAKLEPDTLTSRDGLPSFTASIAGITDTHPYFYLDFGASKTVVWNENCMTSGFDGYPAGSCEGNPTFTNNGFSNATLLSSLGSFTKAGFGGYEVSGTKYTSELCFNSRCTYITVYSGELITADGWQYNGAGQYGILGMGPGSQIWTGFADPDTHMATYSISLGRINSLSAER